MDRIVQSIQGGRAESERRETVPMPAVAESHRTLNEIIRQKTDDSHRDSHRDSREAPGVDGPNLVTHLPDVVVQSDHRRRLPFRVTTQAVLLFLDISGFTALCEKYSQAAKTGTEQLTKTLNGYMSALVSEIITYDGDILKFAGDAILCMWPVETLLEMTLTVENVIRCALDIQRKHGTYTTSDGVTLKVKIGIAAGEIHILIIGNDEERTYIEVGRGIEEVNKAENMCEKGGDVVVAPGAWIHCQKLEADFVAMHDPKFVKVTHLYPHSGIAYRSERTIAVTTDMRNLDRSIRNLVIPSQMVLEQTSSAAGIDLKAGEELQQGSTDAEGQGSADELIELAGQMRRLRRTIITHFSRDKVYNLKLFISKPVLRKIEDGQPLEYLSEMRQVTMLFINLDVVKSTKYGYLLMMQGCYEVIYANAKRMRGCISKIFAFDKGCTFMVIFGLPGYKHENDSAHALGCAYAIYTELNKIVGLQQTSIGVTTGPTYCGIVGHNHRHEYTVIGRRVNMGARLMMHYRGKVVCDNTTFYYSKLNETFFVVQEAKEMKGLQQVGTVREYRPQFDVKNTMDLIRVQQEQKPIIGRDEELAKFELCLDRLLASDDEAHQLRTPVAMILGEIGMGRTRLLNAFLALALRREVTVVLCTLAIGNVNCAYYAVRALLAQLTKCEGLAKDARLEHLRKMFAGNKAILKHILVLDALLEEDTESEVSRDIASTEVMTEIVRSVVKHFSERNTALMFAVDDTHLMDENSWECMPLFAQYDNTMVLLTNRVLLDQYITNETAVDFIKDPQNLIVYCSGLSIYHLASIACQFLNVARIPDSLDHVLRLNSMGIPSWIDLLLREYLYEAVIKIEWSLTFNHTETMLVPAPRDLMEKKSDAQLEQPAEDSPGTVSTNFVNELRMEAVSPNAELVCNMLINQTDDLKVPTSIASMIQARIDHMQEVDQVVLKSASIIGQYVFREILQHMLHGEVNKADLGESIQRLADSGAFACASSVKRSRGRTDAAGLGGTFSGQMCTCQDAKNEKPMRDCRVLTFLSASLRMTAYEMMLEQNRRPLHMSAAHFLEEKIRRLCSGTNPVNESMLYESYLYEDEEQDDVERTELAPTVEEDREGDESGKSEEKKESPTSERKKRSRSLGGMMLKGIRGRGSSSRKVSPMEIAKRGAPMHQRLQTIIGGEFDERPSETKLSVLQFVGKRKSSTAKRRRMTRFNQGSIEAVANDLAKMSDSMVVNYTGYERLGVLRIQYPQIADQYRGAGNTEYTVYYLTEAAAASLALFDHQGAITYLREVNRIFRDLKMNKNPFEGRVATLDNWTPSLFDEGQLESLIGQTLFGMEKPKRAVPHFLLALKMLGCEQETSPLKIRIATTLETSQQANVEEKADPVEAHVLSTQAQCLFFIFEDCVARDDLVGARYAAVQQLGKTERACDLLGQIEASTCMLKLAHLTNNVADIELHETKAKIKCLVAMENIRNDQVIRLTRLYWTAFEVHLARDPVSEAVESGLSATRMMVAVRGAGLMQTHMMESLVISLVFADRIKDAVDVLDFIQNDGRSESRCWFFCGAIQFVLTMGVRVALMEDCISYSDEILAQRMFAKRPQLLFCLACSLCLYYKRVRMEDRFEEWRKVAAANEPTRYADFISAVGFFDLLECKLLHLSKLIGEMRRALAVIQSSKRSSGMMANQHERRYLNRVLMRDLAFAQRITKRLVVLEPRRLILQAIRFCLTTVNISNYNYQMWRGGATGRALDLRSAGYGFNSCSGQRCVTTLGKLFTPTSFCHQAV